MGEIYKSQKACNPNFAKLDLVELRTSGSSAVFAFVYNAFIGSDHIPA
jgi:hypothetical protein